MRKWIGLTTVAVSAIFLLAPAGASAATEVGSNCAANTGAGGSLTAVQLAKVTGDPIPIVAPASGVVTRWKVNSGIEGAFPQQLKVLRQAGNAKTFQAIAESAPGTVMKGQNSFETRIPIQAGDRLGLSSTTALLWCSTANPGDEIGIVAANVAVGSTTEFSPGAGLILAVSATVEPDADNDGFGDETQDKCPRSKAIQAVECPIINLSSFGIAGKGSVVVLVSASSQASVAVSATVKLPKAGKKGKGVKTAFIPAGTKPIGDGQVVPFTIVYSQKLKVALAALPPRKSLAMTVTATTTDLAGQASNSQLSLKLKGQKKGKGKGKGKAKG